MAMVWGAQVLPNTSAVSRLRSRKNGSNASVITTTSTHMLIVNSRHWQQVVRSLAQTRFAERM